MNNVHCIHPLDSRAVSETRLLNMTFCVAILQEMIDAKSPTKIRACKLTASVELIKQNEQLQLSVQMKPSAWEWM